MIQTKWVDCFPIGTITLAYVNESQWLYLEKWPNLLRLHHCVSLHFPDALTTQFSISLHIMYRAKCGWSRIFLPLVKIELESQWCNANLMLMLCRVRFLYYRLSQIDLGLCCLFLLWQEKFNKWWNFFFLPKKLCYSNSCHFSR